MHKDIGLQHLSCINHEAFVSVQCTKKPVHSTNKVSLTIKSRRIVKGMTNTALKRFFKLEEKSS